MLIVAGTLTVDPADVERMRPAIETMTAATLEESGCHQYSFTQSLSDPGVIQIFELWQSPDELQAHFATPHMAEFRQAIADIDIKRELYTYEVSNLNKLD